MLSSKGSAVETKMSKSFEELVVPTTSVGIRSETSKEKIYILSEAEGKELFPEGFPGSREHEPVRDETGKIMFPQDEEAKFRFPHMSKFAERHVLVREFTLGLLKQLDALADDPDALSAFPGWILDGPPGVGKSICLAHIVHHCRINNWLVINIPCARDWNTQSFEWFRAKAQRGLYDQRDLAHKLLLDLRAYNSAKLAKVPVRQAASLGLMRAQGDVSLLDLVKFGLGDKESAVDAAICFRDELNSVVEFPVLLAVDEFNAWYDTTDYHDRFGRLFPEQMRLIAKWREFDTGMKNGIVVGAVNKTAPVTNKLAIQPLLRRHAVKVPSMSLEEMRVFLLLMHKNGQLNHPVDDLLVQYVWSMSSGRPAVADRLVTFSVHI